MTLEEFKRDIAPKMKKGWLMMDADKKWCWCAEKPEINDLYWSKLEATFYGVYCFDIETDLDWKQSLMEVGK